MRYDVLVVGAGPAGSTVARDLAARGASVMMFDKAEFPRDKPCGGLVSVRCATMLGIDLSPVIERTITDVFATLKEQPEGEIFRSSAGKFAYATQRSRLDTLLAEKSVEAGAVFRQREKLMSVERHGDHVTVRTSGGQGNNVYHGRILVAADGANGVASRMSGLSDRPDYQYGIAIEGNITPGKGFPDKWKNAIGVDFGAIEGGYGWLFPKGDHVNIGTGGYEFVGPTLRCRLERLVKFYGFDPAGLWGVRGHHLPVRRRNFPLIDGNVILVGDAAGILDPLTAEGIVSAVQSSQIAANHIARYLDDETVTLEPYMKELDGGVLRDVDVAGRLHDVFYLRPGAFVAIERKFPVLWQAMVDLFCGDATYVSLSRKLGPVWPLLKLISHMRRATFPAWTTAREARRKRGAA